MHDLIDLISAVATGVCEVHGRNSEECGAAQEAATLAITTLGGASLGGAVGGRGGALVGGITGFVLGLLLNQGYR